jgi:aldose sugar dehydrogenase
VFYNVLITISPKIKEIFSLTVLTLAVSLLVFPGIMMTRGQQQQEPSPSVQPSPAQQTAEISQQQVSDNTTTNINTTTIGPVLNNSNLQVELVTEGLDFPTSMAFIGNDDDMIILEKSGEVIFFSSENKNKIPLGYFTVNEQSERGLLGVAVLTSNRSDVDNTSTAASNNNESIMIIKDDNVTNSARILPSLTPTTTTFVFFYLTGASQEDRSQVLGNRIYRFEWNDTDKSLSNGTVILDLPARPGPNHNGGKLIVDSDNMHLYTVIGDLNRNGSLQNFKNGSLPDDTSVIIRINPDGSAVQDNPFFVDINGRDSSRYANLSKYYAYGIRNSFGLAIDPVTGILWDTENGPTRWDEINIVRPGFNSGWEKVMGPAERRNITVENDLVNFLNSSSYADPVFSWGRAVGVTDIEFYDSDKLGNNYTNNIFVGDFINGHLYYFQVNETRSGLQFEHPRLADDLVASNDRQTAAVIFGTGFVGGITDIETGSDGYLYILTFSGKLYRIVIQK